MILLSVVAFVAGLLTILAPCIWPLLPIVLADASQSTSRKRPLGITVGVAISFTVFTLAISEFESSIGLNPNVLRKVAVVVLLIMGISMVIPAASLWIQLQISSIAGRFRVGGKKDRGAFVGGLITGLALGIVWTPCSGPILASIATLAATNKVSLDVVIITLFYVLGVSIPLFGFAVGGQKLLTKSRKLSRHTGTIHIASGVVLILTAVAIYTNFDKTLEANLLNSIPSYSNALTKIESTGGVTKALEKLKGKKPAKSNSNTSESDSTLFNTQIVAPELTGGTAWLNTPRPVKLKSLRGKVVLLDFWTYSCINCIRTLPHIKAWYAKYHPYGLEVIGIHSPEFSFEEDKSNVLAAISRFHIPYPVVQDNQLKIWFNYDNEYWPAEYLIDAQGNIKREDFGEGQYAQTEQAIIRLLSEAGKKVPSSLTGVPDLTPSQKITPETYFGSERDAYGFPAIVNYNQTTTFPEQKKVPLGDFAFGGKWHIDSEYAEAFANSTLTENFQANHVYMILNPHKVGAVDHLSVTLNGKPLSGALAGSDVVNGQIAVESDRLYDVLDSKTLTTGTLKFIFHDSGTQAYTFTFG
jgi:cytochrome c biogenesis protein CcdA/thiol-disulfide isomerase/thioredoxin